MGVNGKTVCIDENRVAALWLLLLLICTLRLHMLHEDFLEFDKPFFLRSNI